MAQTLATLLSIPAESATGGKAAVAFPEGGVMPVGVAVGEAGLVVPLVLYVI